MRVTRGLIVLVAGACLIPGIASATHKDILDPDDTPGRLDIRRVGTWGKPPRWTISTGPRWTNRQIWDRGWFFIYFDTARDDDYDKYALVRSIGGRLQGTLWRIRRGRDRRLIRLRVRRNSQRSVVVRVPLRRLNIPEGAKRYSWQVLSQYLSDDCRGGVCLDRTRRIEEPLD